MSRSLAVSLKDVDPAVDQVALEYLQSFSGKATVLKSVTTIFDVIGLFSSDPAYKNLSSFSKDAKNFSDLAAVPSGTIDLSARITAYSATGSIADLAELVREIFKFLVPVMNTIKAFSNRFIPLSARTLAVVGIVGSASSLFSMMFGVDEELLKIEKANKQLVSKRLKKDVDRLSRKEKAGKRVAEAQLNNSYWVLARNAHYAALSAFGLAATCLRMAAPPPLMVALSVGGVAITIISHFNNKLYLEPAQKRHEALLKKGAN